MRFISVIERLLLTLWVGGLWAIGYMAVPTLFATLEDRKMAGAVAGEMFHFINYTGVVCGLFLLLSVTLRLRRGWQIWTLLAMLVLVAFSEFTLQPMMEELKMLGIAEGSPEQDSFRRLHGVSAVLYLVTSLLGLSLVVFGLQRQSEH